MIVLTLFNCNHYISILFGFFIQYLLSPMKTSSRKIVDAKLKGKKIWVRRYNPINAISKKLKKNMLGLMYFLEMSEFLGRSNNIMVNNGVKIKRWWFQESK